MTSWRSIFDPIFNLIRSLYDSTDHFGEAVYSHELFRMGRPDLCGRMCRGGTADHLGLNQVPGTIIANSLTDQYLMPNSLGNNPYAMAPPASNVASMQNLQGAMNPAMMAQRTNGMNYPMAMNGVMSAQFPGAAAGMGMAQMLNQPSNPFAFNRMSSADMQMKQMAQANHHRESLLQKQNQLIQSGMGAEQAAAANQQQIMSSIMARRNSGQAVMTPTEQLQQQHSMKSEGNEAFLNRRNSASSAALPQAASASSNNANDITKMSILEIEDELLRVKELKLMMMKRKLESQLEANEKE